MPTPTHNDLLAVLGHWFPPAELPRLQLEKLAGGLSGALLWKVTTPQGVYCLRSTTTEQRWLICPRTRIHQFQEHVWRAGFHDLPLPKPTLADESFVEKYKADWELASWLPGHATRTPTFEQAKAAAAALARFHLAGVSFHQLHGCPSGLKDRFELLDELRAGTLNELKAAVDRAPSTETRSVALRIIVSVEAALHQALEIVQRSRKKVPIQWCHVDPHIGNFLFVDDHATGIVDFAIAGASSVARDVARLVGSMVPHLADPWQECVGAYRQLRPLSADELRLIFAFHVSGTIGAAANWLRWRFLEDRSGVDTATARQRLIELAARLESLDEAERALSAFYGPIG
jgi:Ser/Thr protein kinase RdoA (MazF antagonist)